MKDADFGRWSTRSWLRIAGAGVLAAIIAMALLGVFVLNTGTSASFFFLYWGAFCLLLMLALAIAMMDAAATIGKFRTEHAKLWKTFQPQAGHRDSAQQESETE